MQSVNLWMMFTNYDSLNAYLQKSKKKHKFNIISFDYLKKFGISLGSLEPSPLNQLKYYLKVLAWLCLLASKVS